jgi:hypothetical protein
LTPVILIEVVLVLGVSFGWGFYQLYTLRRDKRRDDATTRPKEP